MLSRPGDGRRDLRRLLVDNHEPRERQRRHIRKAVGVYRSLRDAGIVVELDEPDAEGRMVARSAWTSRTGSPSTNRSPCSPWR